MAAAQAMPDVWQETLHAAMAVLHEYESAMLTAAMRSPSMPTATSHSDSSGGDDDDHGGLFRGRPIADPQLLQRRRVAKRVHRNRARDRERRELLRLREELVELETRRAQLTTSRGSPRSTSTGDTELLIAWRQVATRQRARRRDVQDENVRLRERVVEQCNVLQCLKRIIERQLADEARRDMRVPTSLVASPVPSKILDRLLVISKEMFASTGTWDACPGMGQASNAAIRMLSPTQLVVEVVDRRLMPFEFHAIADAYWEALLHTKCASYRFYDEKTVVEGRDTVIRGQAFQGGDDTFGEDPSIRRQTYVSVQRFLESDRAVITNAGQSEFIEVAQHALPGTKIDERYWHVVEKLNSSSSDASYMTTFGRVVLDFQHEGSYSLPIGSVLANYFNSGLGQTFERTVAEVEDLLLQRT